VLDDQKRPELALGGEQLGMSMAELGEPAPHALGQPHRFGNKLGGDAREQEVVEGESLSAQ
jgi:hypothetical protein